MKKLVLLLIIMSGLILYLARCQDIFKGQQDKELLFLGSYSTDSIDVYNGRSVSSIPVDDFRSVKEFENGELLDYLVKHNLHFEMQGDEPFWKANLTDKKFILIRNSEEKFDVNISHFTHQNVSTICMFSSNDGRTHGIIKKVNYDEFGYTSQNACDLSLTDDYLAYEVYFSVRDTIYQGCASIWPK